MSSSASSGFSFMPDENAAQLMRRTRCVPLPTRVGFLDSALRGGALAAGDVLELYGQSASGKTELVYQILLACIMPAKYNDFVFPGIGAGALVVDLDCRFNLLRFSSMLQERFSEEMQTQQPDFDVAAFFESDAAMRLMTGTLDRLFLVRCASPNGDDVTAALRQVPALCANEPRSAPLRLLVIDNVAANFWIHKSSATGMRWYDQLATEVRRLMTAHQLSTVLTKPAIFVKNSNGSGAAPAAPSAGTSRSSGDDSFYLGYAMQNLCRIRVHVRRSEEQCRGEDGRPHGVWSARVTTAARQVESAREGPFYFTILGSGVRELDYKSS